MPPSRQETRLGRKALEERIALAGLNAPQIVETALEALGQAEAAARA